MANYHGGEVSLVIQNLNDYEKRRGHQSTAFISVVPGLYRDKNPSCFDPQVISIGPLHRANKNVQDHEGFKTTYQHDLLDRLKSPEFPPKQILNQCSDMIFRSIKEIKECYEGDLMMYENDFELANMMLKDACFILEFFLKRLENHCKCPTGNRFLMNHIVCDLLLLENQIPFFVLQDIFDCTRVSECVNGWSLVNILLTIVLSTMNPFEKKPDNLQDSSNGNRYHYKHILDVVHKAYQPSTNAFPSPLSPKLVPHSAVELDLAGVHFKPNKVYNCTMAIKYKSSGLFCSHRTTLKMPVMNIHDKTELLFRNLIAYEQSTPVNGYYFTSYALAMDMLVDTKEDVHKLVESKVIVNMLGSNESAANLINDISYGLYYEEFYYDDEWKKLDEYYNYYWPKTTAWLRRRYFNSPWNMIALVAVISLFVLSVLQTIYTIKPVS